MGQEIRFEVEGRPPAKSGRSVLGVGHPHGPRVVALLRAARDEARRRGFQGFGSVPIGLELRVACGRDYYRSDATNYLGGVGDVLDAKARRTNLDHLATSQASDCMSTTGRSKRCTSRGRPGRALRTPCDFGLMT